jgi:hypothetical protein
MLASNARRTHLTLALLTAWALSCSAGCTLITDVDRSRIATEPVPPPPEDTLDSGTTPPDAEPTPEPTPDAAPDAAVEDAAVAPEPEPEEPDASTETDASP